MFFISKTMRMTCSSSPYGALRICCNTWKKVGLLKNKNIYIILTGGGSKEDNEEEIKDIIKYFNGISEWLYFNFEFLDYFTGYNDLSDDLDYDKKINEIKSKLINK